MAVVGARVGAILSAESATKVMELLGYGVYSGDEVPPPTAGGMAPVIHAMGRTNPKLTLDNGDVVWGCQCWWGDEDAIKAKVQECVDAGWTIKDVRIVDVMATEE